MRVTFLGTGTSTGVPVPTCRCDVCTSPDPRDKRLRPSVYVEWDDNKVLIDSSSDLREQALRHEMERIDAILYTHAHADHILGIDDLRLFNWRQKAAIPAYGSQRTLDAIRRTFWYVFDERPAENTRPALDLRPIDGRFDWNGTAIDPIPVMHGKLPIEGYRIGGFAYLTDVHTIPDSSVEKLQGLDLLVINALRERHHPTHLTLEQAAEWVEQLQPKRALFTHMSHEMLHEPTCAALPDGVDLAYDGLTVEIPS